MVQVSIATALLAALLAAYGGHGRSSSASSTTAPGKGSTALGVGVTPTEVKVGIVLVDFTCIKNFTDSIRENQNQVYQSFIDDINAKGGEAGRKLVPVYVSYCPIGTAGPLSVCTKLTEDDRVFAVIGTFIDFSGDAQTCVAKQHQRVLMTFNLTDAILKANPAGLIIYPGATNERTATVLLRLLGKQHTLKGKKVAVLGDSTVASTVNGTIEPGVKKLGVATGTTGILSVSGSDTSAALTQLASFIERWKSEQVNAIFLSGDTVSSKQFVSAIRSAMPKVLLMADTTDVLTSAKDDANAGIKPNPYEGIISAAGPTPPEYDKSPNWAYCAAIYQKYTGKRAPNAEEVVKAPGGKTLDTNGSINDACQVMTMFHDIAARVGKDLNNTNWINTVNHFGAITNRGSGPYSSLHKGKYDVEDNFRLQAYDSSIPPAGNWKPLSPLQNVPGS
jgi:ABC-type branched-subunit amino acid transport system substrate-binding protein